MPISGDLVLAEVIAPDTVGREDRRGGGHAAYASYQRVAVKYAS
jgi:hypothetical protein